MRKPAMYIFAHFLTVPLKTFNQRWKMLWYKSQKVQQLIHQTREMYNRRLLLLNNEMLGFFEKFSKTCK